MAKSPPNLCKSTSFTIDPTVPTCRAERQYSALQCNACIERYIYGQNLPLPNEGSFLRFTALWSSRMIPASGELKLHTSKACLQEVPGSNPGSAQLFAFFPMNPRFCRCLVREHFGLMAKRGLRSIPRSRETKMCVAYRQFDYKAILNAIYIYLNT